jgi:hypothetical protein
LQSLLQKSHGSTPSKRGGEAMLVEAMLPKANPVQAFGML